MVISRSSLSSSMADLCSTEPGRAVFPEPPLAFFGPDFGGAEQIAGLAHVTAES